MTRLSQDAPPLAEVRRALQLARRLKAARERSAATATRERGPGLTVWGLTEYQPGEDARRIDWLATLRLSRPVVREFHRDKERVVAVALDASPSLRDAAPGAQRLGCRLAAALAGAALLEGERAGGWIFTDRVEAELAADSGRGALSRALRFFLAPRARGSATDFSALLARARRLPRGSLLIVISDFAAPLQASAWRTLARRVQTRWLHLRPTAAPPPPGPGWVRMADSERPGLRAVAPARALRRGLSRPPTRLPGIAQASIAPGEAPLAALTRLLP